MIYLKLSVNNFRETLDFYSKKIGLFSGSYNRLICESGPELIIDLLEVGSEDHLRVFESVSHVKSSFTILHEENTKIELLGRLKEYGVEFKKEPNLIAEFIDIKDPSGNAISIGASHGCIR
ncbi:VOC family protein [Aliikangiella coralliicola]|uniref:VOC family protein n=1 Tax=Aliikangiella coralliicola TaxID=2592383 RepID=A0A545UFR4_9GAMM|nr:VOC family protein [Aliikangiella coralliicola]TQV88285.1 VOC family protein [Aliikangiella coralliicola]